MNDKLDENVTRVAGKTHLFKVNSPSTLQGKSNAVTVAMPFNEVKHLLSSKPLRRPNRTRPLDR